MNGKQIYEYLNEDGTTEALEAVPGRDGCLGCVGYARGSRYDHPTCSKLPNCIGIIWVEAVC